MTKHDDIEAMTDNLNQDPIVRRMAAEIRVSNATVDQVVGQDGLPNWDFTTSAHRGYRQLGGTLEVPYPAVARAIVRMAFHEPLRRYRVYADGYKEIDSELEVEAINSHELAMRLREEFCDQLDVDEMSTRMLLDGDGLDHRCSGRAVQEGQLLVKFEFEVTGTVDR